MQVSANKFRHPSSHQLGLRSVLLLILFVVSLYEFKSMGLVGMGMVCAIPVAVIVVYIAFRWKMSTFWMLFVLNYFLMFLERYGYIPMPTSLPNELFEIVLLCIAIIDAKMFLEARFCNLMTFALVIWCSFCTLQVLNDTCDLGVNIGFWYTGARLMAFQLMYACIVCAIYVTTPENVMRFIKLWAICSFIAIFWVWKQRTFGFSQPEKVFLIRAGRTHIIHGIIRYFSVFSDAANFGIHMAAAAVIFYVCAITGKLKNDRILFLLAAVGCTWAMFTSGTRTAIFCMIVGFMVFVFLSKSIKIAIPVTIIFGSLVFMLAFTTIGEGNSMIRRMRTAFDKNDASASVRDINKDAISKYMKDAPWGIGLGMDATKIPANHKLQRLSSIPPDSEYVFIWVHTGPIGLVFFIVTTLMIFGSACFIVLFRIRNNTLRGIGAAICSGFVALHLGGYANQILMQFPNIFLFYGGMSIIHTMPYMDQKFTEMENKRLQIAEEKKRIKKEKKRASRV